MSLEIHKHSHLHGLPHEILSYILVRFRDRDGYFIETFELPANLPMLSCGLFGPIMGDVPVALVTYGVRGARTYASRLTAHTPRPTHIVTVIAGPHDGRMCVLYTVHGGPPAPREPGDPTIGTWDELLRSRAFWEQHALSEYE